MTYSQRLVKWFVLVALVAGVGYGNVVSSSSFSATCEGANSTNAGINYLVSGSWNCDGISATYGGYGSRNDIGMVDGSVTIHAAIYSTFLATPDYQQCYSSTCPYSFDFSSQASSLFVVLGGNGNGFLEFEVLDDLSARTGRYLTAPGYNNPGDEQCSELPYGCANFTIPFTFGMPFIINDSYHLTSLAPLFAFGNPASFGDSFWAESIAVLDASGNPVSGATVWDLSTPEPSTFGLSLIVFLALIALRRCPWPVLVRPVQTAVRKSS
jgi:hypothetical protein